MSCGFNIWISWLVNHYSCRTVFLNMIDLFHKVNIWISLWNFTSGWWNFCLNLHSYGKRDLAFIHAKHNTLCLVLESWWRCTYLVLQLGFDSISINRQIQGHNVLFIAQIPKTYLPNVLLCLHIRGDCTPVLFCEFKICVISHLMRREKRYQLYPIW